MAAIETIGNYQLHLLAVEVPEKGGWDPFVTIDRFDDEAEDFRCALEKYPASDHVFSTYDGAIEQARRAGNALIQSGMV
jgi:hypothetical protein